MYRKIIHIDMDAFYASVEQRDHPEYRGKPIVVGRDDKRGVVAAASYEARRFGIRSAMSSARARQMCPQLIFVPGRMDVYKSVSRQIREIFQDYTDLIEPLSLDEAFLDVTDHKPDFLYATDIAKEIKRRIREELHLVASAGVSYNKFLAKVASDYRKPDGLCTIHPDRALDFISRLPIEAFWGIGRVTARKMHALGIHRGADLQKCSLAMLRSVFGKAGKLFFDFARGVDDRPVEVYRERKSVGCEHTLDNDTDDMMSLTIELYHVVVELLSRMAKSGFTGNTLTVKIKYADFSIRTHCLTADHLLVDKKDILAVAKRLLREMCADGMRPIRLIGASVSNPQQHSGGKCEQLLLDLDF